MEWKVSGRDSFYHFVPSRAVSDDLVRALVRQGEQSRTGRARLCLHQHERDSLHVMLIYHDSRTSVPVHRHSPFGEYLVLVDGAAVVTFYDQSLQPDSSISISTLDGGTRACWVPPNCWHKMTFNGPTLFYEFSQGPLNEKQTSFAEGA
jgi:cupin fold WbuC family metalloprotein